MDYFIHVAILIALYTILSTSYNLLIGYTGLFSIAHAAFYGIGAYTSALLTLHFGASFPLALLGAIPTWPHSRGWGYGPTGGVGLILMIVLILFLLGHI